MEIFWFVLSLILFIGELLLPSLLLIWFGVGALCALISCFLGFSMGVQGIVFWVVSFILCAKFTKGLVRDKDCNYEPVMGISEGSRGVVTDVISPSKVGAIEVGGQEWSAKSVNLEEIGKGKEVEVVKTGVVLVVKEVKDE